jgi:hypothetical protein
VHRRLLAGPLGLLLLAVAAPVASARVMRCGEVIARSTRLDNDLDCRMPGPLPSALTIGADGVTLDLNGHTVRLTVVEPSGDAGYIIRNEGHDHVTIKNGGLTSPQLISGAAIALSDARHNVLKDLDVHTTIGVETIATPDLTVAHSVLNAFDNSFSGDRIDIRDVDALGDGFEVTGDDARIRDSAIRAINVFSGDRMAVRNNTFIESAAVTGAGNIVAGNEVVGFLDIGGTGTRVAGNLVTASPNSFPPDVGGIVLRAGAAGTTLTRNTVTAARGILVPAGATGTTLRANVASGNSDDGIHVDAPGTVIADNRADANGDLGIEAVPGVLDRGGNRAFGNGNPVQCLNVKCTP